MNCDCKSWIARLAPVACVVLLVGCGPGGPARVEVQGTVTLDGAPLSGAAVMFGGVEGAQPATAVTDASGGFRLEAAPGKNLVAVSKTEGGPGGSATGDGLMPAEEGTAPPAPKSAIPAKYADFKTSGLQVDVSKRMPRAELKLSSK